MPDAFAVGPYTNNCETVYDAGTGLTWQLSTGDLNGDGIISTDVYPVGDLATWDQALRYCEDLTFPTDGESDWRLPNIRELRSIVDRSSYAPAISDPFNAQNHYYWSSTSKADEPERKWNVVFTTGYYSECYDEQLFLTRCVRSGPTQSYCNDLNIGNYKIANISPQSDYFTIWMDITEGDGTSRDDICSIYQFSIVGDNGKGAHQVVDSCIYLNETSDTRYRVTFEIDKDSEYPSAAFFENGVLVVEERSNGYQQIQSGIEGLSVYGSTFDVSKDAWSFENGQWKMVDANVDMDNFLYAEAISEFIDEGHRMNFWDNLGTSNLLDWDDKVWDIFEDLLPDGLCYGMASSAIANFNHSGSPTWGTSENTNIWQDDIESHWAESHASSPFNPFENEHTLSGVPSSKGLKKIMYYFVAQSFYAGQNWVGKDLYFTALKSVDDENELINKLLKKGRPALFGFDLESGGSHALAITQLIRWEENNTPHTKYMIWDNNYPYSWDKNSNGPYMEWYLDNRLDYSKSFLARGGKSIGITDIEYGFPRNKDQLIYKIASSNNTYYMPPGCFDSQNIYNLWDEDCPTNPLVATSHLSNANLIEPVTSNSNSPLHHHKIVIIGGSVDSVFNIDTEEYVGLGRNSKDQLEIGKATIFSKWGADFHQLYLPAENNYKLRITKNTEVPFCKVLISIPNENGTVQHLNYEPNELPNNDGMDFTFIVGRYNKEIDLHQQNGSTYPPDYNKLGDLAIRSPQVFNGYTEVGKNYLSWDNETHPDLLKTHIVRRVDRFPGQPDDGEVIFSSFGREVMDVTCPSKAVCFYAAYNVDIHGDFSQPAYLVIDTQRYSIRGVVLEETAALYSTKLLIINSLGEVIDTIYPNSRGLFIFSNLVDGTYSISPVHSDYIFSPQVIEVRVSGSNQMIKFSGDSGRYIILDRLEEYVKIGTLVQLHWDTQNLDSNDQLVIESVIGSVRKIIDIVPAYYGYSYWIAEGPVDEMVTLQVSLRDAPFIGDSVNFQMVTPGHLPVVDTQMTFPWNMFRPAIINNSAD